MKDFIHTRFVVASLDKMLDDNYPCLVESKEQQIKEVRSKTEPENLETTATSKRVWIRPICSVSVAFSSHENKNEEINQKSYPAGRGGRGQINKHADFT